MRGTNSHIKPALKGEVDASATSRRRGCIVAAVIYGNPSVSLRSTAPRPGSLLVRGTNSHIKPALKGEVDASATSRRRGCIVAAVIYGNPSVSLRSTAPRPGSLLVRGTNSHIKPALKGEVDASATSRRRGCIVAAVIYGNPSVSLRSTAPRPGSLLGVTPFSPISLG